MMRLLSKLLPKHSAPSVAANHQAAAHSFTLPSEEAIAQMSLAELDRLIDVEHRSLPSTVPLGFLAAIYRRAMEIAYHSHGTSNEDRALATIIAKATRQGMLNAAETESSAPLRTAIEATERNARAFGYGTLLWLLEEHKVPSEKAIEFIMRPEHAHLLGGMLDTLKPDVRAGMRDGLIAELFYTRRIRNGDSAVFIAHGLAAAYEPATVALFNPTELSALRNAHREYGRARAVLADLGLLPAQSSARGFEPQPPRFLLAECVALELHDVWWNLGDSELPLGAFLSDTDCKWLTSFTAARLLLCCHLALVTIGAIYGSEARRSLEVDLPEGLKKFDLGKIPEFNWPEEIQLAMSVSDLEKSAKAQSINVDAAILDSQIRRMFGKSSENCKTEEDSSSVWFSKGIGFLTRTRVRFLSSLRSSLRALSEGTRLLNPNSSLDAIEVMKIGLENRHPPLWEDAALCPPFDYRRAGF